MESRREYNSSIMQKADSCNLTTISWRSWIVNKLLHKVVSHLTIINDWAHPNKDKKIYNEMKLSLVVHWAISVEIHSPSSILLPSTSFSQADLRLYTTKAGPELMKLLLSQSPRHEPSHLVAQAVFWHMSSLSCQCSIEVFHNKSNFPSYHLSPSKPNLVCPCFLNN